MQRHRCLFSGRVQGVGFRFTACRLAASYDVTGYVRNLGDGRVELVVEGDHAELDALVRRIQEVLADKIESCSVGVEDATSEFQQFAVR